MPIYEYECASCGRRFDELQRITEDALTTDPQCGGSVRRVIQPVGIIFKGSGFYVTDSRNSSSSSSTKSDAKTDSKSSDSKSSDSSSSDSKSGSSSKTESSSNKGESSSKGSSESKPAAPAAA